MLNLKSGKHFTDAPTMTRGGFLRGGIASIIAAKSAPYIALGAASLAGSANATVGGAARGMMRNVGARTAAMFGGGKPTAKDYVQNGLIAMWDGIENAGWGVHDDNTYVWKNLSSGFDLNCRNPYWNDDNYSLNKTSYVYVNYGFYNFVSMEFTFKHIPKDFIQLLFTSGTDDVGYTTKLIDIRQGGDKFQVGGVNQQDKVQEHSIQVGKINTLSVVYDSEEYNAPINEIYLNGIISIPIRILNNGWNPGTTFRINGRNASATNYPCEGINLYCVRMYVNKLTQKDVEYNRMIDNVRFGIA